MVNNKRGGGPAPLAARATQDILLRVRWLGFVVSLKVREAELVLRSPKGEAEWRRRELNPRP